MPLLAGRVRSAAGLPATPGTVLPNVPPLPQIRSLAYFQPVIAELQQQPLPDGYLDYLRLKLRQAVQRSGD